MTNLSSKNISDVAGKTVVYRGYEIRTIDTLDGYTVTWSNGHIAGVKPGNTSKQAAIEWAKARIDEREHHDR